MDLDAKDSPIGHDPKDLYNQWPEDISELEESLCTAPLLGDQSYAATEHRLRKAARHEQNRGKFDQLIFWTNKRPERAKGDQCKKLLSATEMSC